MARRIRWILTVALLGYACGPVQRSSRTTVEGDARFGEAHDSSHGCEAPVERWSHEHVGGSIAVHHESAGGLVAGGRVRVQQGEVTRSTTPVAPPDQDYMLYGVGGRVGFDGASGGGEAGLTFVMSAPDDILIVPHIALRFGDLDGVWGEATIGSDDPLNMARFVGGGIGMRGEHLLGRFGFAAYGQVVPDLRENTIRPGIGIGSHGRDFDGGAYIDVSWHPFEHIGITGGAVLGRAKAGRIGLNWTFGE